mmetsp:Transcript_22965/g.29950  ORF Transcript_22965/g.29950 Transcript_22965/m.29950 type:complete len:404 (-) Transcript_22965:410-1621(-)
MTAISIAVLILCHGRSGSTLLLEALSLTNFMNYFEPLQRSRNPQIDLAQEWDSSCVANGNDPEMFPEGIHCPKTDSLQIANILKCDFVTNAAMLLTGHEVTQANNKLINNISSFDSDTSATWDFQTKKLFQNARAKQSRCKLVAKKEGGVLVKAIRTNGYLGSVVDAWNIEDPDDQGSLRIVQLIRDPRGLMASRLSLNWGHPKEISNPKENKQQQKKRDKQNNIQEEEEKKKEIIKLVESKTRREKLKLWSQQLCNETMTDLQFGRLHQQEEGLQNLDNIDNLKHQTNISFMVVRYEDLVLELEETLKQTFQFIGKQPDHKSVENYILSKTIATEATITNLEVGSPIEKSPEIGSYSTAARNGHEVIESWRHHLAEWEIDIINEQCHDLIQLWYSDQPEKGL